MSWAEVDRLVSEDKYQAAVDLVGRLRAAAREAEDEAEWTRALIKEVLLRTALHGYETSVRFLRDEPWPDGPRYKLALELFYAQSLTTYVNAYSWEVRQRERVVSTDEVDLKKWTLDQLYAEAQRAYLEVWNERDAWGDGSLGDLAEYFEPGNYPAHVRGTLRDAVTYLWVELLMDTSLWRPEHSNETYRLGLDELFAGGLEAVDLADPAVHPLRKASAVLVDLEAWHTGGGRPEAAFEARLELVRRLTGSFSREDDLEVLRAHLRERLDALGRHYPWWSTGMAELAELTRRGTAADALVETRRIALAGQQAHPESFGGQRCQAIVAAIEQPSYELAAMASDAPNRRSIQVRHKNLAEIHFRAYAIDLVEQVEKADDSRLLPGYQDVPVILQRQRPVAEWTLQLPETPDYRSHATYVTPPPERSGLYLVVASARRDFAESFNRRTAVNLILGDLVLVRPAPAGGSNAAQDSARGLRVVSGGTGKPLPGVDVALYRYDWRKGHTLVEKQTSGADGEIRFESELSQRQRYFALARRGDDVALMEGLYVPPVREPQESVRALIYTDRSIYRPNQDLFWKVVAYRQKKEPGRFEVFPKAKVNVTLMDANGQEAATVQVVTNEYGSASGQFEIPAGRLLGQWSLRTRLEGGRASQVSVKVEEYKRPTFEVEITDPEEAMRLNRPAKLSGEARYYFGLPVTAGEVSWRVTRAPVWRWFGWFRGPGPIPGDTAPQTIAAGTAQLGPDGRFEIDFTPEADERLAEDEVSYRYVLDAEVTDEGGETRSATRAFRLGFVAVEASMSEAPGFVRREELSAGVELEWIRRDLDGNPRPGNGNWRILGVAQPDKALLPADLPVEAPRKKKPEEERYRTPGDLLRPRWGSGAYRPEAVYRGWPDGAEVARGVLEHGEEGEARLALPNLKPGVYRIRYSTEDAFGATFEAAYEILVLGGKPAPLAVAGLLEAERTTVPVGDVVRLAVHSGLTGQEMELAIRRFGRSGGELERRKIVAGPGVRLIELPVDRDDRGGLGVTLSFVADHQLISLSRTILVPWDDRELKVEFGTFRDKMRPGATETWTLTVRGSEAEILAAGAAEILAYMYDKSLDLFADHSPPNPLGLYPTNATAPGVTVTLGQGGPVWNSYQDYARLPSTPHLRATRLKVMDGYGIGGPGRGRTLTKNRFMKRTGVPAPSAPLAMAEGVAVESAMAPPEADAVALRGGSPRVEESEEAPPEPSAVPAAALRSDFSETAFWEPHLLIGEDGAVKFEFTVPDSLTEWNVWAHALTRDLRSGRLQRQVKTAKELMVRPYLPRFLREGDRAELRVVVNNAGEAPITGQLDFEIRDPETEESLLADFGLSAAAAQGLGFTVEPGGGTELSFPIRVPSRLGTVAFVAQAHAGDLSDGELRPLPVLPSRVHLAQSRFVTLRDEDRRGAALRRPRRERRPHPDPRPDGRDARRAALLRRPRRLALPGGLSLQMHRADAQPLPVDRHRLDALRGLSRRGPHGAAALGT